MIHPRTMTTPPPPPPPPTYEPATGENHTNFLTWSRAQGITFHKITPARFQHAGLGIASTAPIAGPGPGPRRPTPDRRNEEPETIAFTPTASLLTRENLVQFAPSMKGRARPLLKELGTHACFAAAIAGERGNAKNGWAPWMRVWPGLEEFREGVPLLWKEEEQELLPPSAISILDKQKKNFGRDFEKVKKLGFEFTRDEYIYAWLIVNTRSLFYKPDTPEYKELTREHCMALCPFIDYFNHSDDGCKVELSPRGYTVTPSAGSIPADTQLFVTYGCHSNDFLLCEYGFLLPTPSNKWDEVSVDSLLLPALNASQRSVLEAEGFLGGYVFDRSTFCFRTQAAVRMMLIKDPEHPRSRARVERWKRFLVGEEDGEREREEVERWLVGVLRKLRGRGRVAWGRAEDVAGEGVARLVKERWEQVLAMVESVGAEMGVEDWEEEEK
ncbi:hypothetical protein DFP73DRAFT_630765 [Morchella snyderi]|nr:hypothetical protein DFP73DRAFT_630765 [Morchella snyderi]